MEWIIIAIIIAIVIVVAIINGSSLNKASIHTLTTHNNMNDILPKLLELAEKDSSVVADSFIDNQYSKNKIGWYLNSYQFVKDYNDKYIADVDFFDNEKRVGDIRRIVLRLNPNPKPITSQNDPHIYKSSQIKQLFIKGLEYRDLTDDNLGKFYGYVKTEPNNKFDKYAIAVFDDKDRHIGYVPKGEEYLFNTLELVGGKQQAWGYIYKEVHTYSGSETLMGRVFVPVKCSVAKVEKAIAEFKTKRPRKIVKL